MANFRNRLLKFLGMWKATDRNQSHGWREQCRMIQIKNVVILLALLLVSCLTKEEPEPIFKAIGGELEMGFCFGVDIAVYRLTAEGRELLGQASRSEVSPPEAFKGRISISNDIEGLLGLKISNLQFSDSGIYIRECWSDTTMDNYRTHYLYVCSEEVPSQEISMSSRTGADLVCNVASRENTTVKWYRDVHNISLFMDTDVSLEPLQAELRSSIKVYNEGLLLHVSDELIMNRPNFFCLVMEGEQCRSFQTIGLPEDPEVNMVYRSVGENVVLVCSVNHLRQNHWKTPYGQVNSSQPIPFEETTGNHMFVSTSLNSGNYSLVIDTLTLNHSGGYRCFSTVLIEEYAVTVCPLFDSSHVSFSAIQNEVVLPCDFLTLEFNNKDEYTSVLWYRNNDGKDILIMDSGDPSLSLPDQDSRLKFSPKDFSLVISDPKMEDSGTYWCVVLLNHDGSYDDDDDDEDTYPNANGDGDADDADDDDNEDDSEVEPDPLDIEEDLLDMCLYRQVTNLNFHQADKKRKLDIGSKSQPNYTVDPEPEPDSNLTTYAVFGGLGGLLLVAVFGIVLGLKMRNKKKSASAQGKGLELSEEEGRALKCTTT